MASFNSVNYSLRPSKSIQRSLVFSSIQKLQNVIDLDQAIYVGFGSVWFSDFIGAHKILKIRDMISIESNDIGYTRACFNRPYKTVEIEHGLSTDVLPRILAKPHYAHRPWILWLDYDQTLDEGRRLDLQWAIEHLPQNSVLLTTFSASGGPYGRPVSRPERLRTLFGDVVPDDLSRGHCSEEELPTTLAQYALDYMSSVAAEIARPGGFLPAISIPYKDGTPMVTVGGVLPARGAVPAAQAEIASQAWQGRFNGLLEAPHLTIKEATAMQAMLPTNEPLDRAQIQALGFDLDAQQIEIFGHYYQLYPAFAQVIS